MVEAESMATNHVIERAKAKMAQKLIVPAPLSTPCPTVNRDIRGECCVHVIIARGVKIKGNSHEDGSDNFNICQSQESLAETLLMPKGRIEEQN